MQSFTSSPVWGAIIAIAGGAASSIAVLIGRLVSKVSRIEDKVDGIVEDVTEIKSDQDLVRWSDVAKGKMRKRRHVL